MQHTGAISSDATVRLSPLFKIKVALEALKVPGTLGKLVARYRFPPSLSPGPYIRLESTIQPQGPRQRWNTCGTRAMPPPPSQRDHCGGGDVVGSLVDKSYALAD